MHDFHDRITAAECSDIFRSAWKHGWRTANTTSLIVHDLGRMRERLAMLHEAFPAGTLHALAIKANPLVEVLVEAVRHGMGLEAASMEEVHLALAAGCPTDRIVFDSPAKTHQEIAEALELGVLLNANSFDELERIDIAQRAGASTSRVGLRVNPELGSGSIAHTSVAQATSKFGVPMRAARDQIFDAFSRWRWLRGLHVHVGSQGCSLEMLTSAVVQVNHLRTEIESHTGRELDFIDIGGGLPAIYLSNETAPTPREYAQRLHSVAGDLMGGSVRIITEFGRAIQAGCGVTFSRIEYVRSEPPMAVIHVGADHLVRPVYAANDWRHEFLVLTPEGLKRGPTRPWTIAGPLCFSGDILGREIELPEMEEGDWMVIRDTGAYTLSMWSRHCSRSIPLVLGYDSDSQCPLRILREAESPTTIAQFWSKSPTGLVDSH